MHVAHAPLDDVSSEERLRSGISEHRAAHVESDVGRMHSGTPNPHLELRSIGRSLLGGAPRLLEHREHVVTGRFKPGRRLSEIELELATSGHALGLGESAGLGLRQLGHFLEAPTAHSQGKGGRRGRFA